MLHSPVAASLHTCDAACAANLLPNRAAVHRASLLELVVAEASRNRAAQPWRREVEDAPAARRLRGA
eukprot:3076823-Prymnesium_polylepis.1